MITTFHIFFAKSIFFSEISSYEFLIFFFKYCRIIQKWHMLWLFIFFPDITRCISRYIECTPIHHLHLNRHHNDNFNDETSNLIILSGCKSDAVRCEIKKFCTTPTWDLKGKWNPRKSYKKLENNCDLTRGHHRYWEPQISSLATLTPQAQSAETPVINRALQTK